MLVINESTLASVGDGLWLCRPVSFTPDTTPDQYVVYKTTSGGYGYGTPSYYVVATIQSASFVPLTMKMRATIDWIDHTSITLVPAEYSVVADLLGV